MNSSVKGTVVLMLAMLLTSMTASAAPRIIYFNGSLGVTRFDVEMPGGTSWMLSPTLEKNRKYRFKFRVVNNSGNPANFDITNLKVLDMLKPWGTYPRGDEIVFTGVHITVMPHPQGIGAYEFYRDETFTGPMPQYAMAPEFDRVLERGKSADIYVYFIYRGATTVIAPALPGNLVPQVKVKAKEMRVKWLPEGPVANLQPNT
jgi:hypothetical protein